MSHLIHVIEVKKNLTEAGVLCPIEQTNLLNEAYIRAGLSRLFNNCTKETEDRIWVMLDKWNKVSPINGRFIHTSLTTRLNKLKGSMTTTGMLPCSKQFTMFSESGVNVADMEGFPILVTYLIKELVNCNE